ncbi:hypothetical protein MBLNU13_g02583t1 [Cladosporium sp. NU13]
MDPGYNGGQPEVSFVGDEDVRDAYPQDAYYGEVFPEAKPAAKKGKKNDKNDKSTKEKKPAAPIVPSYEGYMFTVLDPIKPGETVSWIRTRKSLMPLSSQELHDKAIAYKKESGLGASGQFQALGPNQQAIVNRLVDAKNAAEKEANAAWTLFGVRRNYKELRTTFKTWRINDAIRVTIRRGDKTKDVVSDRPRSLIPFDDKDNIVDLSQPAVKKEKGKEKEKEKEKEKDPAPKKKKKQAAANAVPEYSNDQQHGDPYHQQNDYAQNVDPYPVYENTQPQQQAQWPQQHPQHHPDPFQQPQHDPFSTYDMSGALPAEDAIPVPPHQHQQHEYRPEAPMPPQQQQYQENPFQSDPRVFPQAQPAFDPFQVDERQPRSSMAHGQQPISARRPSHSRQRSPSRPRSLSRHRESMDSDRRRAEEERKIAAVVRNEVRNEVRGALRDVAAEDKVLNRWHTRSGSGSAGSSSRSTLPEDFWSQAGSSGDRRFSYNSTPGTSPDRGERYYTERERPTGHFRRRDSSGARPYVDDRKRYYMERDKNYVVKPHDTYREHGREPRYLRDRRQSYDDYPFAHQRRPSRDRLYDRPRMPRRVTDYPEAFHDADFGRPSGRSVDYERTRMYDKEDRRRHVHEERRGGRDRQPTGYYG